MTAPAPPTTSSRGPLFASGFLAFLLIGALQAYYGPAFPALQERFAIDASQVSLIVSFHFLGSVITILAMSLLLARFSYRVLLTAGAVAMAAGSFGVAFGSSWALVLAAALLIGLGFGVIDVGGNLLFARTFGARSGPVLNLLAAMFGIGAVLGPALIALFLPSVRWPFLLAGAVGIVLALLCSRLPQPPPVRREAMDPLPWGRLLGFVLLFFLYVSAEVAVASWETEHLAPVYGASRAALFTSLYWAALTAGRFVAVPLSARLLPQQLLLGATLLALFAAALAHLTPLAPWAYLLVGLAFAPIFPTGVAWLHQIFPEHAERFAPLAFAAGTLGPVVTAPLIGQLVAAGSSALVPTAVTLLNLLLALTALFLWWRTRRLR